MLGKSLSLHFKNQNILCSGHKDFDITNKKNYDNISFNPDIIINCAAYTNVTNAESDKEKAFSVNECGTRLIAEFAQRKKAKLIHFSTDYVFSGREKGNYRENEVTDPVSVYGKSKLAGEKQIIKICSDYLILRISWLFGPEGKNFASSVAELIRERDNLSIVSDQFSRVTYTEDVASALDNFIEADSKGIYHIADSGKLSRYDFTVKIHEILKRKKSLQCNIKPISHTEYPDPTPRPSDSSLNTDKYEKEFGGLPNWENALERFFR